MTAKLFWKMDPAKMDLLAVESKQRGPRNRIWLNEIGSDAKKSVAEVAQETCLASQDLHSVKCNIYERVCRARRNKNPLIEHQGRVFQIIEDADE